MKKTTEKKNTVTPEEEAEKRAQDYMKWYAAKYPGTDETTLHTIKEQHRAYLINTNEKNLKAEKFEKEWMQRSAREECRDYFDNTRASLKRMIEELDRYDRRWQEFMAEENYYDACNCLEWTALHLQQHNPHSEQAVRAAAKIAVAFNVKRI